MAVEHRHVYTVYCIDMIISQYNNNPIRYHDIIISTILFCMLVIIIVCLGFLNIIICFKKRFYNPRHSPTKSLRSEGGDMKDASTEHFSPISPPCRTPTPARGRPEKENRIPLSARTKGQRCASPPSWTTAPTPKKGGAQVVNPGAPGPTPEFGDDGRQRQKDLRLASKLDMVRLDSSAFGKMLVGEPGEE